MTTTWERFAGREDRFAVRMALRDDPDVGRDEQDLARSWGSFQLWVNGKNLCAHVDQGETLDSVHWHLLPLLEWLATNWDPLFHEERLPVQNRGPHAAASLQETVVPSPAASAHVAEAWEQEWFDWWERHALRAARAGGSFPDAIIRRWRDRIEFSWSDSPLAGETPMLFLAGAGSFRADPADVGAPLLAVLTEGARELHHRVGSERSAELVKTVGHLEHAPRVSRRIGWMAGLRSLGRSAAESWSTVEAAFAEAPSAARDAALRVTQAGAIVQGSSQAALLFGAVAPDVTADDVQRLATLLIEQYAPGSESERLQELTVARDVPVDQLPWQSGYELAEDTREALSLDPDRAVDLEALFDELGIEVKHICLDDRSIRGVTMASAEHRPTVAINDNSVSAKWHESQRFTLAHELCHLLFDRARGRQLAVASGPWAPLEVEQRANAFGAAFLMPPAGIRAFLEGDGGMTDEEGTVERLAAHYAVTRVAMIEHLRATGFISNEARAELRGWYPT